jgi:hypothetical protein
VITVARIESELDYSFAPGPPFSGVEGYEELLRADLGFTGSAVEAAASPIVRHPSSSGSSCQVVSAAPSQAGEIWQLMTAAGRVLVCAGLFPAAAPASEDWIFSALRLVLVGGTRAALNCAGPAWL